MFHEVEKHTTVLLSYSAHLCYFIHYIFIESFRIVLYGIPSYQFDSIFY